ncbi:MAG: tetratricopeptide repeat protein [Gemmatimonadetes bacterium]|jgi:TolB-like protein|nr:tetratricopeptide repeat protein [Gemmatimonadota bacterium]
MKMRWSCMLLTILLCTGIAAEVRSADIKVDARTIAVMYFQNNAMLNKEAMAPLEKGLTDMLITELSKIEALKVVERAQLQALIKEMKIGQTGVVDAGTAQQMGKLLGAETLLLGSFATDMAGKKMRIDARIVETETGLTLKAEEITDKVESLFKMVGKLTRKIAKQLDVKLTKGDKKRLGEAGNESFQATMIFSRGLELEDEGEYEEAIEMYEKALEINPDFTRARERIEAIEKELEG